MTANGRMDSTRRKAVLRAQTANLLSWLVKPFVAISRVLILNTRTTILCYHSIDDYCSPISISLKRFESHMRYLAQHEYQTVLISELVQQIKMGRIEPATRQVAITFDDGFKSVFQYAAPILRSLGQRATLFVIPSLVGSTIDWQTQEGQLPSLPLMSWPEIRSLTLAGWEIGAHTLSHRDLTTVSKDVAFQEVWGSVQAIQRELGLEVSSFAYPEGRFDNQAVDVVREAGLAAACTTIPGQVAPATNVLALPRVCVGREQSANVLQLYLSPLLHFGLASRGRKP